MSELQEQFDAITIEAFDLRQAQKFQEALNLVQPFADKGLPVAQHIVGTFYYYGEGVSQDYKNASEWLSKAAEQSFPESLCMLGHLYLYGVGVSCDEEKAIDLLIKAVNKSNAYACY